MYRKYFLTRVDKGVGSDITYTLIFEGSGKVFVRSVQDYEQPYKSDTVHDIYPESFEKIHIDGSSLAAIVAAKVDNILPPSN